MKLNMFSFRALSLALLVSVSSARASDILEYPDVPTTKEELDAFIAKMKDNTIPSLEKIALCTKTSRYLLTEYKLFKDRFFLKNGNGAPLMVSENSTTNPDTSFEPNYKFVLARHEESLSLINGFIGKYAVDNQGLDLSQALDAGDGMEKDFQELRSKLKDLLVPETLLFHLMSQIDAYSNHLLMIFRSDLKFIGGSECKKSGTMKAFVLLNKDIGDMVKMTSEAKDFLSQLRSKRTAYIAYAYGVLQNKLARDAGASSIAELKDLQGQLIGLKKLSVVYRHATDWYLKHMNYLSHAQLLGTHYLWYREPLRLYAGYKARVKAFKEQIEKINAPSEAKIQYLSEVALYGTRIQNYIDNHLELGWAGLYQHQQWVAEDITLLTDDYSQTCRSKMSEFLQIGEKVSSLEGFESLAEPRFKEALDICEPVENL